MSGGTAAVTAGVSLPRLLGSSSNAVLKDLKKAASNCPAHEPKGLSLFNAVYAEQVKVEVDTWEGRHHTFYLKASEGIGKLKQLLAKQEGLVVSVLRLYREKDGALLARKKGCPFANIAYAEYELSDDVLLSTLAIKDRIRLTLELNRLAGCMRGGVCPHPGRTTEDFAQWSRSPWARHKSASFLHGLMLKIHGYSAIAVWVLFAAIYFTIKGSPWHVILGRFTAYVQLPISMVSGLVLFRMLFFRVSAFENIMKQEGPITILIFSLEMIMTWLEAFAVPSVYFNIPGMRQALALLLLASHFLMIWVYIYCVYILCGSVRRSFPRRSPQEANAFENAVEMLVLVIPMLITNVVNIPVHVSVMQQLVPWKWAAHHKLNALLLPYIAMPGTTLVLGRDAYWFFHPGRVSTMGLHNLRDRLLVQNVPILLYLAAIASPLASTLGRLTS